VRGRTTGEVAAVIGRPEEFTEALLRDERRRGHALCIGGTWQPTPRLVREFGPAFGCVTGPMPKRKKGDQR
jgi:hypothetical protein